MVLLKVGDFELLLVVGLLGRFWEISGIGVVNADP